MAAEEEQQKQADPPSPSPFDPSRSNFTFPLLFQ